MTARRLSDGFPIHGSIWNRDDGQVEMVVEGDSEGIAGFLRMIHGEFGEMIRDVDDQVEPIGGESLKGFTIRY